MQAAISDLVTTCIMCCPVENEDILMCHQHRDL